MNSAAAMTSVIRPNQPEKERLALYADLAASDEAMRRVALWDEQEQGAPELEAARRDLLPALLLAEDRFRQIPRQWPAIFERRQASKDEETHIVPEMRYTGLAQYRPARANPETAAIGMLALSESFVQTEEIVHADVLNEGRRYAHGYGGDECPLFSSRHPYYDGRFNYSNIAHWDLNETAIEAISGLIRQFRDQAGLVLLASARKLVVPTSLEFTAARLLEGFREDGEKRQRGPLLADGYCVLDFLRDQNAWFLTSNIVGLRSIEWEPFRLDIKIEGDKLVLEGTQSYGCGVVNPRGIFGSFPEEALNA